MTHHFCNRAWFILLAVSACLLLTSCGKGTRQSQITTQPADSGSPPVDQTVKLLVIDDPPLASAIEKQWPGGDALKLEVQQAKWSEIDTTKDLPADAAIYPAARLGELVERQQIVPMPVRVQANQSLEFNDFFRLSRDFDVRWGIETYAFPLGSPQLALLTNQDLLGKIGRPNLQTWDEYVLAAKKFSDRAVLGEFAPKADQPWVPVAAPLADGWAGQTLLAHAAGYAFDRDNYSLLFEPQAMTPRIDQPPFVEALKQMVELYGPSAKLLTESDPQQVAVLFYRGQCGLAITWPSTAAERSAALASLPSLRVIPLPGAARSYHRGDKSWKDLPEGEPQVVPVLGIAGRVASVCKSSRRSGAAWNVLTQISGKELIGQITPHSAGTTVVRQSQVSAPAAWLGKQLSSQNASQYVGLIEYSTTRPLVSPRIPGRDQYMAALDKAVQTAVRGEKTSEAALKEAAATWQQITEKIGVEAQRKAYRRDIGLVD